ncbi:hypothetical protein SVIOM74S_04034 [Streptomyces violarus]
MALTLAGMTAPNPRDTGVAEPAGAPAPAVVPDDTVLSRRYRALSIGVVSVVLLIAFEATAVGTAMPVAALVKLNGVPLYAFAFSGYFTTSLFGMVLSGQLVDPRGPLAPLTWGIASFAAGLLIGGTAGSMWLFILGRAVQGLGGGLVIVALYVVVGRAYPERLRPAIMAAFAAAWVVPSIVGPLASGAVTEHLGWRWVFLGIPVIVVLPLALALPQIRRLAGAGQGRGRGAGLVRPPPYPAGARDLLRRGAGKPPRLVTESQVTRYLYDNHLTWRHVHARRQPPRVPCRHPHRRPRRPHPRRDHPEPGYPPSPLRGTTDAPRPRDRDGRQ